MEGITPPWESGRLSWGAGTTDTFTLGFVALLQYEVLIAKAALTVGDPEREAWLLTKAMYLLAAAEVLGGKADPNIWTAARKITNEIEAALLPRPESKHLQHIELIGHSRGASVNALVAYLLAADGYYDINYIALDGYGTDWSNDGSNAGALTTISITGWTDHILDRQNYRAAFGLAWDSQVVQFLRSKNDMPPEVLNYLQNVNQLRAPERAGFSPDDELDASHTTITTYAFASDRLDETYVGRYADETGSGSRSRVSTTLPGFDSADAEFSAESALLPPVEIWGFNDGTVETLAALLTHAATTDLSPVGIPFVDEGLASLSDPRNIIDIFWQTTGDVRVLQENGDSALELVAVGADSSSVAQEILMPERAASIDFDLHVLQAVVGDSLDVEIDGQSVVNIPLSQPPGTTHVSIPIVGKVGISNRVTFQLVAAAGSGSAITLDNLTVMATPNQAPVLAAIHPSLSRVARNTPSEQNLGALISDLVGGVTDADTGALKGIAIVGANTAQGEVQYSLDDGSDWESVGAVSVNTALLLPAAPGVRVRFVPKADCAESVADVITFRAWDRTTGLAAVTGDYVDTVAAGGTTAFSQSMDRVGITVHLVDASGSVTPASSPAVYTFLGSAGQKVFVEALGYEPGLAVNVRGPDGRIVLQGMTSAELTRPLILGQPGDYSLNVFNIGEDKPAEYELHIADVSRTTALVVDGLPVEGQMGLADPFQFFTISGQAGQRILFSEGPSTSGSGVWTLYDADGQPLVSSPLGSSFGVMLPRTADYLVSLAAAPGSTAAFSLSADPRRLRWRTTALHWARLSSTTSRVPRNISTRFRWPQDNSCSWIAAPATTSRCNLHGATAALSTCRRRPTKLRCCD